MECPRCHDTLLAQCKAKDGEVVLDYCRKCRGIWFDASELERVLDVAAKDLVVPAWQSGHRSVPCPKCGEVMKAFQYPQTLVEVDVCGRCSGVWLDGREFNEIKIVRENLLKRNRLQGYSAVHGLKGVLIRFIESSIDGLTAFWR